MKRWIRGAAMVIVTTENIEFSTLHYQQVLNTIKPKA